MANSREFNTPIVQLNLGKRITASNALYKDLKTNQICILQEPQHRKNRLGNVPRSHQQFVQYSKDKIKVAILLPKDLSKNAMILGNFSSADSLVLRIKITKNLTILLASIYMDFIKDIPSQLLTRLCNFADTVL